MQDNIHKPDNWIKAGERDEWMIHVTGSFVNKLQTYTQATTDYQW